MKLFVTTCEGNDFGRISTVPISVAGTASVDDLKVQISLREKVNRAKLRLCVVLNTVKVLLADGQTCSFYNITEGTHIHMEVLGGLPSPPAEISLRRSKLLAKLGLGRRVFSAGGDDTQRSLENVIQKCKEGRLDAFIEAVEMSEQQETDPGLEDDHFEHEGDKSDSEGWTCYHHAAFHGFPRIISYLNSKRFNPNRESKDGWTPLMLAAGYSHLECVRELLKHPQIQINRTTWRGTALHQACHCSSDSTVELLLESGACMTQEDARGRIALQVATKLSIIEMIPRFMGERQLRGIGEDWERREPPPFCGEVRYAAPLRINDRNVYLVLDTGAGELLRFKSQREFLAGGAEEESVRLVDILTVANVDGSIRSKGKTAIFLEWHNSKAKYTCRFPELAEEWVARLRSAVEYSQVHVVRKGGRASSFTFRNMRGSGSSSEEEERRQGRKRVTSEAGNSDEETAYSSSEVHQSKDLASIKNFHIIEELGSGSFGKVFKVRGQSDSRVYALKSLNKQFLAKHKQLKYAISECRILKFLQHPFIIRLFHAFQTPRNLYMVLEYCPNGDLAAQLEEKGNLGEAEARVYLGEILLAVEYLHAQDIVYRDLKPENVLLDCWGHVRLADFGLAKEGITSTHLYKTFCGSPAYFAPEVMTRRGAGKPADIYGIGAIFYEMLTGHSPFFAEDSREFCGNLHRQGKLTFPKTVSEEAKEVLRATLNKDAAKRPSACQLKSYAFFQKLDWRQLLQQKVPAPSLGSGWHQGDLPLSDSEVESLPLSKVDRDYSEDVSMEECLLDFD